MKVYLDTVGCRLNQAEIEAMARQFCAAGHQIVASAGLADLAVINTCSVTAQAASDSRSRLRSIALQGEAEIVITGCWATLHPRTAASMPGVSRVVNNQHKDGRLVGDILGAVGSSLQQGDTPRVLLPRVRKLTRAFIMVQQLGSIRSVLWESTGENPDGSWRLSGLTDNYVRVRAGAPEPRWIQIDQVLLGETRSGEVLGCIAKTG